ncbi:chitin deacetylase 7-like [Physella acuta]|uniref:chitin deacetylase 7-like n=1 Tax=Physella acuta TaxID=109671 RepID=UPI0027DEA2F2|nr:chitin deacetylase 7-like [Physella acuta]
MSISNLIIFLCIYFLTELRAQHEICSRHTCHQPTCRCPAHSIPGNIRPEKVPQMILIAFDDAVNWDNWKYYLRLFPPDGRRKNPNGCPISSTFFVSHNFTDYCMVRKLHARGMEIGDHSVTHKLPRLWWTEANKSEMQYEVLNQRRNLADLAHIPLEDIRGWRSPFLQPAGDDLFSVLYENNFTYDATMTYSFPKNLYSPVLWPFTLDFGYTLVCNIARCPQEKYPGMWILPVVVLMDYREQKPCAYVDDCANMPREKNEAYQMLWKNFLRNYRSNRAPLYLNLHSPWLNTEYQLDAMDEFIEKLTSFDDVYIVTVSQALQWQMNPTPLDQIKDFKPFQCPTFEANIEDKKKCTFTFKHSTAVDDHNKQSTQEESKTNHFAKNNQEKVSKVEGAREKETQVDYDKARRIHTNVNNRVHSSENDFFDEDNNKELDTGGIHHHHSHKTHKPWFLKGDAPRLIPHITFSSFYYFVLLCLYS